MIEITSNETFHEYEHYFRIYNINLYQMTKLLVSNLSSLSGDEINKYNITSELIFVPFNIESVKTSIDYDNMNKYLDKEYNNDIKQFFVESDNDTINRYIRMFNHDIERILYHLLYIDHPSEELFNIITYKNINNLDENYSDYSDEEQYDCDIDLYYDEALKYSYLTNVNEVLESMYDEYVDDDNLIKIGDVIPLDKIPIVMNQIITYNNCNKFIDFNNDYFVNEK